MKNLDGDGSSALIPTVDDDLTAEERDSETDRIKVNQLHAAILYAAKRSLEDGILIGEILAKRKAKCGHGNWLPWLKDNAQFTAVTASNYIRLFENAEWLKSKNVFDLTDARLQLRAKSKAEGGKPRGRGPQKRPKEEPDQEPADGDDETPEAQEHYSLQTLEGVTVYFTEAERYEFSYNLEGRGQPLWTGKQPQILQEVEEALGVQCQWVLAPEPPVATPDVKKPDPELETPIEYQQPQNGSDPAEPLVTVEQTEEKLDLAIQQHKAKLDAQFHAAVNARVQEFLENTIMPKLQEEQTEARRVMEARKGVMDRKSYKKILSCLHPDRVTDPGQKALYEEAFRLFTVLEKRLLDEKNSPTQFVNIPKTRAEWDELKRQANERKTKRKTQSGIARQ